jgi:diguanylate cyclase (GGDEF)-like protein
MAHSRRYEKYLGVCFIDLDDFKPVNDNFGHEVGDELLISVSERITSCIREDDTLSRLGGDEFALLLNDLDSLEQCENTLQRILSKLKQPHYLQDEKIDVSASIGVSLYPIDNSDIDTLLRHADQAMYQAKMQGKHRYQVFDIDYDQKLSKKTVRINEIRSALKNGELELYYQPKINLLDGSVFGVEALLRWNHPTEGIVPPLRFLPLIENTDLELEVGEWVIQQAIIQLETWQQQNIDLQLSINIASYHLQSPQFVERLVHFFSVHPTVNAEQLQIEILESSVLSDIQHISATINACQKELGIKVALDDFGTGYSSLTHIRSLSANTIKIDQSFVRDLLDDPNDFVIIDSVIKMASSFNCSVIAEGVETIEDGLLLLSMGCFEAQGYVISKPLNQQAFSDWLVDYEPNEKWQQFIHTSHTKAESTRLLFQLSAERWKERFVNSLMLDRFEKHNWPILNSKKCHCGRWLKDNKGSKIFNVESVAALDHTHEQLHQAANELYQQYLNDNVETARNNLPRVQALYESLQQIIQHKL